MEHLKRLFMPPSTTQFYELSDFRLDSSQKVLLRNGGHYGTSTR